MRVNLLQGTHALNFQSLITFVGKAGGETRSMRLRLPSTTTDTLKTRQSTSLNDSKRKKKKHGSCFKVLVMSQQKS